MDPATYVPFSPDVEVKQPGEDELIENIVESMERVNRRVFDKHRHATRDAHAKSHGILKGTLSVNANLPEHLRQGLFAEARDYPVVARLSSAPGDIQDDRIRSPKGMAIKVVGAPGGITQDFLLVNFPVIPFGHVAAYWEAQQKMEKHADDPEILQRLTREAAAKLSSALHALGKQNDTVDALGIPNHHILGETFHSMAALRFGAYIAKISAAPLSESVRRLTGQEIETSENPSAFRDSIVEFFGTQAAEYELRAQLCTDLERMPIEDGSVEWPEELSPHQPVAKLIFPSQDAYSPARRVYADDILSFNPWHCLEAHRPLGSIMRVRLQAYERSAAFRHAMNAVARIEPRGIEEIPD